MSTRAEPKVLPAAGRHGDVDRCIDALSPGPRRAGGYGFLVRQRILSTKAATAPADCDTRQLEPVFTRSVKAACTRRPSARNWAGSAAPPRFLQPGRRARSTAISRRLGHRDERIARRRPVPQPSVATAVFGIAPPGRTLQPARSGRWELSGALLTRLQRAGPANGWSRSAERLSLNLLSGTGCASQPPSRWTNMPQAQFVQRRVVVVRIVFHRLISVRGAAGVQ